MSQAGILSVSENDPSIPTSFQTNSGNAVAIAGVLEILGSGGVTTSASGNIITISISGGGFTWNVVTSTSPTNPIQIAPLNAYICAGASLVAFLLPLSPTIGDTFKIFSQTSRFRINQNANQKITVGASVTTVGSGGYLISNAAGDEITLSYAGNNSFQSEAPQGTVTLY